MERRIREEEVTKRSIEWLINEGWEIICYDFPQSGTGIMLHPNSREDKNRGGIIPDIVAHKNSTVLFFENKERFALRDFKKIDRLIHSNDYSIDIKRLLKNHKFNNIYYGVSLASSESNIENCNANLDLVQFIFLVDEHAVYIHYDPLNIILPCGKQD
ncbi:MAG: hypothetical protein SNH88_07450 [Rikenellaceae bacterium]